MWTRGSERLIVFTLWLLVFSSACQTMIIAPILPLIGEELSVDSGVLGTLVSAYSLMVGAFAILAGPVSDRVGRRRILLWGCSGMCIALGLHAFATDYISFLVVRALAGMAGGVLTGAAVSYIGDYFPYRKRGWATGWVMSGSAVGQIAGLPVGILLADGFGVKSPFYLFGATMALTVALIYFRVPQPRVRRKRTPLTIAGSASDYLAMLRRPVVAWAAAAYLTMFLGISSFVTYFPAWLEAEVGFTGSDLALMYLFGGLANVITGPQAGRLSDRVGRKRLILVACVGLCILTLATVPLVRSPWIANVYFLLTMMLVAMRISPFSALLTELVKSDRRGSLMSLTVATGQLGYAVGAAAAGPVYAGGGFALNTVLAAVFILSMGMIVWFRLPEPEPGRSDRPGRAGT